MIEIKKLESPRMQDYLRLLKQLSPQSGFSDHTENFILRCLKNEDTKDIYLAYLEEGGSVVGTISIQYEPKVNRMPSKSFQTTNFVAHIEDVVVDQHFRLRGIGKALVRFALEKAKDNGCYKVCLDCDEENRGFYEACGLFVQGLSMRYDM